MRLNVAALAIAGAVLWGGCVFLVGLADLAVPGYGAAFLAVVASMYPGFHVGGTFPILLLRTGFALADGAIAGAIVAWIYNVVVDPEGRPARRSVATHDLRHSAS
jgi:hypothetical protein